MNTNQIADAMFNRDTVEVWVDDVWQTGTIQQYEVASVGYRSVAVMFTDPQTSVRCVTLRGSEVDTKLRLRSQPFEDAAAAAKALGIHLPAGPVTMTTVVRGIENLIKHSKLLADELNGPTGVRARLAARTTDLASSEKLANAQADRVVSLRETNTSLANQLAEARRACEKLRVERDAAVANSADTFRREIHHKAKALADMPIKDITTDVICRHIDALRRLAGS